MPLDPLFLALVLGAGLIATTLSLKGKEWSSLLNQDAWTCMIFIVGLSAFAPHLYMTVFIIVIGLGMMWTVPASSATSRVGWRIVMWIALYLVFLPVVQPWMIPQFLFLMLMIGAVIGAWTWLAHSWGEQYPNLSMNMNHTHSIAAICVACGVALMVLSEPTAILLLPALILAAAPIIRTGLPWKSAAGQGWGHLVIVALGAATVFFGWKVWAFGVPIIALCLWAAWDDGGFHTRRIAWMAMIRFVWRQGWRQRLMGNGMGSWSTLQSVRIPSGKEKGQEMPDAHNAMVHMFAEYGIVGVIALVALLAFAVVRLNGDPLVIVGLTMCSVAAVNAPWTLTRSWRIRPCPQRPFHVAWYGSPAMTMISFTLMLLIDGVYEGRT